MMVSTAGIVALCCRNGGSQTPDRWLNESRNTQLKDGSIHGYEALSRIVDPKEIKNTEDLFYVGALCGKIWELERICRKKILRRYSEFSPDDQVGKLFINVNPLVITDESFKSHFTRKNLDRFGISPNRIVIEITERSMVTNTQEFLNAVAHYKSQGYQIAIDDVGACYSGLNVVCETYPHYLKIDMPLVRDIDSDQMKYALVKGLVEFAKNTSVRLLAEGIETEPELNTLLELGVDYGQGYLIGKPKPEAHPASIEARRAIKTFYQQRDLSGNEWDRKVYRPVAFTFENCKSFYSGSVVKTKI